MLRPTVSRWAIGIEYKSLTVLLAEFRKQFEKDASEKIGSLDVNGALLLNDLCVFLGLDDKQRREVLGDSAAFVDTLLNAPIDLSAKH